MVVWCSVSLAICSFIQIMLKSSLWVVWVDYEITEFMLKQRGKHFLLYILSRNILNHVHHCDLLLSFSLSLSLSQDFPKTSRHLFFFFYSRQWISPYRCIPSTVSIYSCTPYIKPCVAIKFRHLVENEQFVCFYLFWEKDSPLLHLNRQDWHKKSTSRAELIYWTQIQWISVYL